MHILSELMIWRERENEPSLSNIDTQAVFSDDNMTIHMHEIFHVWLLQNQMYNNLLLWPDSAIKHIYQLQLELHVSYNWNWVFTFVAGRES